MASKKSSVIQAAFASSLFDYAEQLEARGLAPTGLTTTPSATPPASRKTKGGATLTLVPPAPARDTTIVPAAYAAIRDLASHQIQDDTFEWYRPQSIRFTDAKGHPTPLMESVALASTKPPVPTYVAKLPAYIIKEGILSESQLEAITYAGEAHTRSIELRERIAGTDKYHWVPVRQGYMLGDGAGSGKGRTCAGLIFDNYFQGRKKAIWISENERLYNDALRDYYALGGKDKDIVKLNRYKIGTPITLTEGVIFCTYATLRSQVTKKDANGNETTITRLDQIIDWLGGDAFDGVIIFDESQNLQNAMESATSSGSFDWGSKPPSQQALASLEIQSRMPLARVMYASATSADHLEALAYAPRLGLWGKGTAFPDRADFLKSMEEGGMTALEMICRDLKAMGVYCSRQLSMEGVTSEVLVHDLTKDQITMMLDFNKAWRLISTGMEQALITTGAAQTQGKGRLAIPLNGQKVGYVRSRLESAKQRFYMLALISLRVPTIIEDMKQRLAAGESCVLQLHNTQEASLNRALEELEANPGMPLDQLDVSPRRELIEFVRECYPTDQYLRTRNEKGNEVSVPQMDPVTGLPVKNAKAVAMRDNLIANLQGMLVPEAPIDMILDAFGPDAIAEITGRKSRLVWRENLGGQRERVLEKRGKNANAQEIEAFMNGPKRILVFSESSGGVGASYHSDRTCSNQTRRNHYLVQIPWRSIDAVQGMGRTNRTNQASFPHYVLTTTNVPAELRFISTIARRLDQLGSLTRGQRDANSTNNVFSSEDNLETKYGEAGLREMMKVFEQDKFDGMTRDAFFQQTGIDPVQVCLGYNSARNRGQTVTIPRFLNRLLAVDIDEDGGYQQILLNDLRGRIEEIKSQAMTDGTYDAGLQTIAPLSLKKISDVLLRTDPLTGAETRLAKMEKIEKIIPLTFAQAKDKLRFYKAFNPNDSLAGWFKAPDGSLALHIPVRHMQLYSKSDEVRVITPFGEKMRDKFDGVRYQPIAADAAKTLWEDAITNGPTTEKSTFHVVYGALLPIWDKFTKSMPQIWRMQSDDGERILGRRIPAHDVKAFKASFGV